MAEDVVICAECLGKKYVIGHEAERERYEALRDVLARGAKNAWRRTADIARGRALVVGDKTEEFWALKDVNFEVKRGEVIGIIGRNGAGKSTLLKILSRITEPTAGRVRIRGRVASLLEVGTGFHPELTGRENIYLNGAILGMTRTEIREKFDEIVAFAEVERFLDTPVKRYSSGMYVRLAFAVAAHLQPEILLIDEVLAVGDVAFQKKCLGKMGDAARTGRTILFVSHNTGAIGALCPKTIYFDDGQIKFMGATSDVIPRYLSRMLEGITEPLQKFRLAGGDQVTIHGLRLETDDKKNIRFGQPIAYSICVRSRIDAKDLTIGHSVFNASGVCVGTLITDELFSIRAGEEITLKLVVANLFLAPGRYYAGFSVGRGGKASIRQDLDIIIGQPWFEIISLGADITSHWHPNWGNIVITGAHLTITPTGELTGRATAEQSHPILSATNV